MVPVVLEVHVEAVLGISFVVEPGDRVLVPHHVDVLEENVVPEHGHHLDAIHLGDHHVSKGMVGVLACGVFRHGRKNGVDVDRGDPHGFR